MASQGRNERCSCGSGLKAKRCCGTARGPAPEQLARAFLADQSRRVAPRVLAAALEHGHEELFAEMLDLPAATTGYSFRSQGCCHLSSNIFETRSKLMTPNTSMS